jgi:hypothetical protein
MSRYVNCIVCKKSCKIEILICFISSGPKYYLSVDRGRCIDLPAWISVRESQMSINPEGYCLKMFETNQCKTSILRGTKKPVEFIGCRNPKQIGLQSFKSFIIVPC